MIVYAILLWVIIESSAPAWMFALWGVGLSIHILNIIFNIVITTVKKGLGIRDESKNKN